VRDVRERTAMDEGGIVLERLHEIRRDRIAQQRRHGAMRADVARENRLLLACVTHDDLAEAFLQILQAGGQTEDGHDFRRHHDVETILTRITIRRAAERHGDVAQCAVIAVHDAAPGHAAHVEARLVAVMDVVVDERGQQVVGERDRGEIPREVQVDVFHGHDL
jgi:hypothetical protein